MLFSKLHFRLTGVFWTYTQKDIYLNAEELPLSMPFTESAMARTAYRWHDLKCSGCGHEFENGEPVYSHTRNKKGNPIVIGHLCKNCYEAKYIDV